MAQSTGIPITKLVKFETESLKKLDQTIKSKVIGQDEAVEVVSKAIRRSRTGISDPKKPIGSIMFLGPTGVGKTELARVLAEELFNDKDAIIKVDMSEFMEIHNVARLVGAPAGYVGYEDAGQLTGNNMPNVSLETHSHFLERQAHCGFKKMAAVVNHVGITDLDGNRWDLNQQKRRFLRAFQGGFHHFPNITQVLQHVNERDSIVSRLRRKVIR